MTIYTVHMPVEPADDAEARLLRVQLVKDGFHWLALVFPLLWLLFNRVWWGVLAYLAVVALVMVGGRAVGLSDGSVVVLEFLVGVFLALVASDLKSWQLGRRGIPAVDVVSGASEEEAERRFFDRVKGGATAQRPGQPGSTPPVRPVGSPPPGQPVLGLFPEAGGAR